jgi:AcrR family transcriptional regulator
VARQEEGRDDAGTVSVLPPARREPLSRDFVEEHQRGRVIGAVALLAHEFGIEEVTVTRICRAARLGRANFYELLGSRSGGLRYAFAGAFERVFEPVRATARGPEQPWLARLSVGLELLFAAIVDKPLLTELCLVHSPGAAPESRTHDFEAGVEVVLGLLAGGREAGKTVCGEAYRDPGPLAEEYLARSIVSLAALRISQGKVARLPEHRDEMLLLAANAFFGPEEAGRAWRGLGTSRQS